MPLMDRPIKLSKPILVRRDLLNFSFKGNNETYINHSSVELIRVIVEQVWEYGVTLQLLHIYLYKIDVALSSCVLLYRHSWS